MERKQHCTDRSWGRAVGFAQLSTLPSTLGLPLRV